MISKGAIKHMREMSYIHVGRIPNTYFINAFKMCKYLCKYLFLVVK